MIDYCKISIILENILLILNKLYSNDIKKVVCDQLKIFYQQVCSPLLISNFCEDSFESSLFSLKSTLKLNTRLT